MISGMIGKKVGMTQIFDKDGNLIPVTLVETGPCKILGLRETPLKVVLGYDPIKESKISKARAGYFKKAGVTPFRKVKEFSSSDNKDYKVGDDIKADFFKAGDYVDVSGRSVGKGFQGGMKRHGWSGGPGGHGSMHHRRVGAIGACADPSKTDRGRTMPGQMGNVNRTVQGLRVLDVDLECNVLVINGALPGSKNSIVTIRKSRKKEWKDLDEVKAVVQHKVNPMKQSKKGI